MDKKYKVRYETQKLTKGESIKSNGFSSITFRNLGDDNAVILGDIPLNAHVAGDSYYDEFYLINRPGEIIEMNIPVNFAGTGTTPEILVIKTFYE